MREIKFRAWDKVNKKMGEVRRIHFRPYKVEECHFVHFKGEEKPTPRCILMQYTGTKDKNEKEVYEGDIFIFSPDEEREPFVVVFKDGLFGFECEGHTGLGECSEIEVIGNIYENPELLNDNSDNK